MKQEYAQRHLRAVELDKILQMLARETACKEAEELALAIGPETSLTAVEKMLQETDDAYVLMARFGSPSFGGLCSMENALRRAQAGAALLPSELLRLAALLRTLRGILDWRSRSEGVSVSIGWRFECIQPNKYLEEKIFTSIVNEEEIADAASVKLSSIRRKIRAASQRARDHLDKMIRSPQVVKYLQDPIVTMREGRFVVPVRSEFRNEVPGLVHDTSQTGATVFIEPMSVVQANNEIRLLLSEEKAEIERILLELSGEAGTFADSIIESTRHAIALNVLFAKGSLAYKMKAVRPKVNGSGRIRLLRARHPLIDPEKVVPTDILLGQDFDTLVVTGPNTGGKTVSLKTTGLLCLMAMCGLMIPAGDESEVSVFDRVLVDIGDEQSIEQSLSTFSSHMVNQIRILEQADERTLVLLDELGAGTDPIEGAALAEAMIEALRRKGVRLMATTHYAELKAYALRTPGVENACCEFDVKSLRPTYRLLIGVPGKSNAFAIAGRLGLPEEIVSRARDLVSSESTRFSDVVEKLEAGRQKLEDEKQAASQAAREAEKAEREAQALRSRAELDAQHTLEQAKVQAARLVSQTRAQVDALLQEMEELRRQKNKQAANEQKARLRAGVRQLENTADPIDRSRLNEGYVLPRPLKKGDSVLIFDIDKNAVLLEDPKDGTVLVQAGIIKTRVDVKNLRLLTEKQIEAAKPNRRERRVTRAMAGGSAHNDSVSQSGRLNEIDLRGKSAEEALSELDLFLDHAMLSNLHEVTVIHGKGTGVLRTAVQQHLRHHKAVRSFRLGVYGEGESGVTIVELK